jgi:hypothetical protein
MVEIKKENVEQVAPPVKTGGVVCEKCGGSEWRVLDEKTGLVQCIFCRSKAIKPEFKKLNETEKYLAAQKERPIVQHQSSSETEIAEALGRGLSSGLQVSGMASGAKKIGIGLVVGLAVLVVAVVAGMIILVILK